MNPSDAFRLIFLSAVWGASFLFMVVASPEFGALPLTFVRVGGAALVFTPLLLRRANRRVLLQHGRSLLVLGCINTALPFGLLAWAALSLEAGYMSLLNAGTPIFTALLGFLWLREPLVRSQWLGLLVGFAGIAILCSQELNFRRGGTGWAVLASLAATASYGLACHYAKLKFQGVSPLVVSAGCLFSSALLLCPFALVTWSGTLPSATALASAAGLALLCTALAFVVFYDLLTRTGATAAATVTFIVPVFGVLWGMVFLSEVVKLHMWIGMGVALLGTALVTRLLPRRRNLLDTDGAS